MTALFVLFPSSCRVDGNNGDCIDPERPEHEEYLAAFKRTMIEKLRVCIDRDLAHDPDGKG